MERYIIPKKFKKAEIKDFRKDRNLLYKEANKKIDKNIGKVLEQLYEYDSENYVIGIHRTSLTYEQVENEIFQNGIEYGYNELPYIHDHVQVFKNYPFFLVELLNAESYKNSIGSVIVKVPKSGIDRNAEEPIPIFYKGNDDKIYLKPEYVCAYVPVNNRTLGEIKFNSKTHIYNDDTEYYYDEVIENIKNKSF